MVSWLQNIKFHSLSDPLFSPRELSSTMYGRGIYLCPTSVYRIWVLLGVLISIYPLIIVYIEIPLIGFAMAFLPIVVWLLYFLKFVKTYRNNAELRKTKLWYISPMRARERTLTVVLSALLLIGALSIVTCLSVNGYLSFHDEDLQNVSLISIILTASALTIGFLFFTYTYERMRIIHLDKDTVRNNGGSSDNHTFQKVTRMMKIYLEKDFIDTQIWRSRDDIQQAVYRAGMVKVFFRTNDKSINPLKLAFFTNLMGPIVISLLILIAIPYIAMLSGSKIDGFVYPAMIMGWATFSYAYYWLVGSKHIKPLYMYRYSKTYYVASLSSLNLPEYGYEESVRQVFVGKGLLFANLVFIAMVPAYLTYISVF